MAKRIKDTDYLAVSARVRAMESGLLNRERMEQLLEARSDEDAAKVLQECGYPALDPHSPDEMDAAFSQIRRETWEDLSDGLPDPALLDFFRVKYDYHNAKAILKGTAVGADPARMLSDLGRVPLSDLREGLEDPDSLPGKLGAAVTEAREILETTRDPQRCDMALDRWYYADLLELAQSTGSAFLTDYARMQIDAANLRALVRTLRMGRNAEFLKGVLFDGGEVDGDSILHVSANHGSGLADLYAPTPLKEAADAGADALQGGPLTEFERLCDDAAAACLDRARLIPFGDAPLIGYLAARETEYANLRILLLGRAAGLPAGVIRSRLRALGA